MKSITQTDQEQDAIFLISLFLKLIDLKELSRRVNFKRKSKFNLVWLLSYLLELHFSRHSLFRAGKRRIQARRQMNNVTVKLIRQAVSLGVTAKYVLLDFLVILEAASRLYKPLCHSDDGGIRNKFLRCA